MLKQDGRLPLATTAVVADIFSQQELHKPREKTYNYSSNGDRGQEGAKWVKCHKSCLVSAPEWLL